MQRNWSFNNVQLARCLPQLIATPSLTALDLRATWVCDEGVAALARLSSLRRLAISPQHEHWSKYLPLLTQLTALVLRNLPSLPYQLMEALAALPDLRELDLAEPPPPVESTAAGWATAAAATAAAVAAKAPLHPYTIAALSRLHALRYLDLSRCVCLPGGLSCSVCLRLRLCVCVCLLSLSAALSWLCISDAFVNRLSIAIARRSRRGRIIGRGSTDSYSLGKG